MQLSKEQRRNLELYALYGAQPPTLARLFRRNLNRYLVMVAMIAVLYLVAPAAGMEGLDSIVLGMFIGVLLRDVGTFRRFVQIWPALAHVLDWQRLERLLAESKGKPVE